MNDQLTIVLTLKDRTPFTHRWMRYMNDVTCPYPILIADGGADRDIQLHLQEPGNYPRLRYEYRRYPFDENYAAYYRKFADVIDRVSTPYVLLADNDDFFLLENIPTFLRFLDDNESFVSCGGNPISFRLLSSDNQLVNATSASQYVADSNDRPKSVTADAPADRVCYFMTKVEHYYLWSSWYHIHRAPAVKQAVSRVREYTFRDPVAFEIHLHWSMLLTGKYKVFDLPLLVGQQGTSQFTSALIANTNLVERFIRTNAFDDISKSLESFASRLSEGDTDRIYKALARWFADQVLALYPAPDGQTVDTASPGVIQGVYRSARRSLRPLKRLFQRDTVPPSPLRLPVVEKYILGGASDDGQFEAMGRTDSARVLDHRQ